MSVIGIVGEYNPFHYGHKYHITESIKQLGEACPVVCVMSGDFVQRGEAAVYSKSARAEAAVKSGVDLVLELPVPWALSSAEGFARGAVGLLGALGVVTHLSFGSECGEIEPLCSVAELLLDPTFMSDVRRELDDDEGISFAAARQRAAAKRLGAVSELLSSPNNILAVEYIKSIYELRLNMKPMTVGRVGAGHDSVSKSGPKSAAELRRALAAGSSLTGMIPEKAYEVYLREERLGRGPVLSEMLETAVLSRLRMLPDDAFAGLPDAGEGLHNRIASAAHTESSLDAVLAASKSKRYALSRIRRIVMCAALGIQSGDADGIPPYARVLAANDRGCALLRDINERASLPIITKPATIRQQDPECRRIFDLCSDAHDLFVLGFSSKEERKGSEDWRISPKIVHNGNLS